MGNYIYLAISIILFLDVATAQETQTFKYAEVTISIPRTWVAIPRNNLDMYEEAIASMAPDIPRQTYAYGFQSGESDEWFDYPTVLIQVMDDGKLSKAQFRSLQQYKIENIINDHVPDIKIIFNTMPLGQMYYDDANAILWSKDEIEYADGDRVTKISGIVRTEHGVFQVIASSGKESYSSFEQIFISIITSVMPSKDYECK